MTRLYRWPAGFFVALQSPRFAGLKKRERQRDEERKGEKAGRERERERVRRECSLELEQSQLLHSSSFFLLFSSPPLPLSSFSPLLSSMNPRGVSSRNITHKPPRLLLFSNPCSSPSSVQPTRIARLPTGTPCILATVTSSLLSFPFFSLDLCATFLQILLLLLLLFLLLLLLHFIPYFSFLYFICGQSTASTLRILKVLRNGFDSFPWPRHIT